MPRLVMSPRWTLRLAAGGLIALAQCAGDATAELTIGSLPRRERMERRVKSYLLGRVLGEVECEQAKELFKQASECDWCVGTLQVECPDCCLKFAPRAIRCTEEEDSKYACAPLAFLSVPRGLKPACEQLWGCPEELGLQCEPPPPTVITHCQNRGCSDPEPNGDCKDDPGGGWWCTQNHRDPKFIGCRPHAGISRCVQPYYDVTKPVPCSAPPYCFRYTLNDEFDACIKACENYTDQTEDCRAGVKCCRQDTCGDEEGGYDAHCVKKDVDGQLFCQKRVDSPECDGLTPQECQRRWKLAHRCLMDGGMACHDCFRQIDEHFVLRFVAKSGSELVIFWQMAADPPTGAQESEPYFYTMVRVIDDQGRVVHESLVHQKSLKAATTVSASTAVDGRRLEQGRPYQVRLYYFLPPIEKDLKVVVKRIQLLIVETRE